MVSKHTVNLMLCKFELPSVEGIEKVLNYKGERLVIKAILCNKSTVALRFFSISESTKHELEMQGRFMELLSNHSLPVPTRYRTIDDNYVCDGLGDCRDMLCVVDQWMPGSELTQVNPFYAGELGKLMAKIHSISENCDVTFDHWTDWNMFLSRNASKSQVWENVSCADELIQKLWRLPVNKDLLGEIEKLVNKKRHRLKQYFSQIPSGPVHSDLFPNNILLNNAGEISGVIDFHCAGHEILVNELGATAVACCYDSELCEVDAMDQCFRQWLLSYQSVRRLSQKEVLALKLLISILKPFLFDSYETINDQIKIGNMAGINRRLKAILMEMEAEELLNDVFK